MGLQVEAMDPNGLNRSWDYRVHFAGTSIARLGSDTRGRRSSLQAGGLWQLRTRFSLPRRIRTALSLYSRGASFTDFEWLE